MISSFDIHCLFAIRLPALVATVFGQVQKQSRGIFLAAKEKFLKSFLNKEQEFLDMDYYIN
jgi:hypothetical protein